MIGSDGSKTHRDLPRNGAESLGRGGGTTFRSLGSAQTLGSHSRSPTSGPPPASRPSARQLAHRQFGRCRRRPSALGPSPCSGHAPSPGHPPPPPCPVHIERYRGSRRSLLESARDHWGGLGCAE